MIVPIVAHVAKAAVADAAKAVATVDLVAMAADVAKAAATVDLVKSVQKAETKAVATPTTFLRS